MTIPNPFAPLTLASTALAIGLPCLASAQGQRSADRPGWPCAGKIDPAHFRVAEATGGQVFLFHPAEVGESSVLMIASMKHEETVLRIAGTLVEGVHEFQVPVDSTIESVLFSVSLQCLQVVDIVRPSGDELRSTDEGVEYRQFEAGRIVTLAAPTPGLWKVTVAGRGLFFLVVQAKTELTLDSVTFVERGGRPGHEGLFPIEGAAKRGQPQLISVSTSGAADQIAFRLTSSSAETIQALELAADESGQESRTYIGPVTPNAAEFRVAMTGRDPRGYRFQRMDGRLFTADP